MTYNYHVPLEKIMCHFFEKNPKFRLVKVGRALWLRIVGNARQGAASRQMRPLANETEQSPHMYENCLC